jgi:hypothetical protein
VTMYMSLSMMMIVMFIRFGVCDITTVVVTMINI